MAATQRNKRYLLLFFAVLGIEMAQMTSVHCKKWGRKEQENERFEKSMKMFEENQKMQMEQLPLYPDLKI